MNDQGVRLVVLVVEDDPDYRYLLSQELEGSGLEQAVYFFSNVEELIDFYQANHEVYFPALILLNAFLPVIDIRKAVELIRKVEALRSVPLVVMLASAEEEKYIHSFRLKVTGFVVKPIELQYLQQFF